MQIKAHMIVTINLYSGDNQHSDVLIAQAQNWLNELISLPDNIDKIGSFLYTKDEEPASENYEKVRLLLEINNGTN